MLVREREGKSSVYRMPRLIYTEGRARMIAAVWRRSERARTYFALLETSVLLSWGAARLMKF